MNSFLFFFFFSITKRKNNNKYIFILKLNINDESKEIKKRLLKFFKLIKYAAHSIVTNRIFCSNNTVALSMSYTRKYTEIYITIDYVYNRYSISRYFRIRNEKFYTTMHLYSTLSLCLYIDYSPSR